MKTLVSILALALLIGCGHLDPAGVYHGDKVLYNTEAAIPPSHKLLEAFVSWEYEQRAALAKWPEIRKAADRIRRNAAQWESTANKLHDAYVGNPTDENRKALDVALGVLQAALIEANGYMLKAALPPTK